MTGLGCMSTKGISEGNIPQGDFRLRSFNTILNFLGRSLEEDSEYHVEKDPRTPQVYENPVHTMELVLPDGAPSGAGRSIQSHGKYYAVNTTGPLARWNREAFKMLYLLFQVTISEVPRVGVPSITITKCPGRNYAADTLASGPASCRTAAALS